MKLRLDEKIRNPFAEDVRRGLGGRPKVLPPKYFYDALGSQLFEAICQLPWYPITRAETALLTRSAGEMVESFGAKLSDLVELGSGSGEKVALLARALVGRPEPLGIHLVDISAKALELSRSTLSRLDHVIVSGHCAPYEAGLRALASERKGSGARLVLFLGSNVGNFDPEAAAALLGEIRAALRPGDGLLLGADLVRSEAELVLAYDDPLGVTAAFDKNVLQRINTELGGEFDLSSFDHQARWDARASRIEMHLVSRKAQAVRIEAAEITAAFGEGETIWTESSYKYTPESIAALGRRAGFSGQRQWIEEEGRFSMTLFGVEAGSAKER
jgi:L-histidine N-alpha-methyltransferase